MIVAASKYGSVRGAAKAVPPPKPAALRRARLASAEPITAPVNATVRVRLLPKPAWKDLDGLADGMAAKQAEESSKRAGVQIIIPRHRDTFNRNDWFMKEIREGGVLQRYLERERHTTTARFRRVAKHRASFQQNNQSDVRLAASIPAKDYFRALRVDRHFWHDRTNCRAYKRDNPDAFMPGF